MKRRPTHPGTILSEDVLPKLNVSREQLAGVLGVSRMHLYRILNAESPVTADMAVKLGTLFGNSPEFWLNLQNAFDIAIAEKDNAQIMARIRIAREEMTVVGAERALASFRFDR